MTLFHRIAVVLLKVARPDWATRLTQTPVPARGNLRYPFWVLANHPQLGAELAAAAGCDPIAVTLIRQHQETGGGAEEPLWGSGGAGGQRSRRDVDLLLTALRTADNDN